MATSVPKIAACGGPYANPYALAAMLEDGLSSGQGATYFLISLLDHPDFDVETHGKLMPAIGLGVFQTPPEGPPFAARESLGFPLDGSLTEGLALGSLVPAKIKAAKKLIVGATGLVS